MYSWKDKVKDWWDRQMGKLKGMKVSWVGVASGVAIIILAISLGVVTGGLGARIEKQADDIAANLTAITGQVAASQAELEEDILGQLNSRWQIIDGQIESSLDDFGDRLDGVDVSLVLLNRHESTAWLAGEAGNYTLYVKSVSGGNFTANVHLVFSGAVGNWSYNGTGWPAEDAWFNIGWFVLSPGQEAQLPVDLTGLNITMVPALAYAEVFRLGSAS